MNIYNTTRINTAELIKLTQKLIQQPSITPNHHACHNIIKQFLEQLKFNIKLIQFKDTLNIWAYHTGQNIYQNTLLFLGHTDVVSPGNIKDWKYPPFSGFVHNNILYGRGAADMKGSLAAMLIAAKNFIRQYPSHKERLSFLITSDEEGNGINGTTKVVEYLIQKKEQIDYCIVGEPSSYSQLGDTIKNGRRGSLTGELTIYGKQGHVAYPEFSKNPIHLIIPILPILLTTKWDKKNSTIFPPTTIQITNIYTNNQSNNITPSQGVINLNFRFNDQCSEKHIKEHVQKILEFYKLNYHINWTIFAKPYFSKPGKLANTVIDVIKNHQKITPILKTTGGTSDGRFIAKMNAEIIELGFINRTIHQINECINLTDLTSLSIIYQDIIKLMFL